MDFAVPTEYRVKLKETEKRDKCLDFAKELKENELWNKKVPVIPIVIGALRTVNKGWLVAWVLWHINLCRLFNAKSNFI